MSINIAKYSKFDKNSKPPSKSKDLLKKPNSKSTNHSTSGIELKNFTKDIGIIGFSRILTTLAGVILIPVLTKNLGAYGYGLWTQAIITITMGTLVLRLGTPLSIVRLFPGRDIRQIGKDFYSILILVLFSTTIFSSFLFLFPEIIANAIFDGNIIIVRIIAIIIIVSCLDKIFLAVFQAFREMKKHAIIEIVSTFIEQGSAIALVLLGYGLIGAIISVLIVRGSLSILLYILLHKKIPFSKPNISSIKEHISVGLPATPGAISELVVSLSDRYIIGIFLGATFVGYYAPGYSLGMVLPSLVAGILSFVLFPSISEFYEKGDIGTTKKFLRFATKFFLMIAIPASFGIIVVGKPILLLFTTPEIAQEGYIILLLISFVGILVGIYNIFKQTIFMKKRTKLITKFWIIGASINLIGNIVLIPRIGIIAAGITTVISYFTVTILVLHFNLKEFPMNVDYLSIFKIIISSLLMIVIIYLLQKYLWSNFLFLIFVGIVVYFFILYGIKGVNKNEIKFFRDLYR